LPFEAANERGLFCVQAGSYNGVSMLRCLDLDLELVVYAVTNSRVDGRETRTARLPSQKIF
jgi:hypothetical protein